MDGVRLGRTGLRVFPVGFGGIPIVPLGPSEAAAVVRRAFELGVTLFDTARLYRDSEAKIGAALEHVRDRVVLATKTMARDAEGARRQVEASLADLRTDRVDLYQLHNVSDADTLDRVLAPGGAWEALDDARRAGAVRFIGVTSHNLDTALDACRTGRFDTLQFPFNFVEPEAGGRLFDAARGLDMGLIAMKPLGGGWLDDARLCFRFLQEHPDVVPIPGIAAAREIEEIVALYRAPGTLTDADWSEMARIGRELGARFCHRCEYCLPCPQGVRIPLVLGFPTFRKRFGRAAGLGLVRDAMASAERCTGCGECLPKCPYQLRIPDLLEENLARYREFCREHGAGPDSPAGGDPPAR